MSTQQPIMRDLTSYKEMHRELAKKNDCLEALMRCSTLTEARKVVFGDKYHERMARQANNSATCCTAYDSRPMRPRGANYRRGY